MKQDRDVKNERRGSLRYRINVPISATIDGRKIAGFTRDLSNRGVYFYLDSTEGFLHGKAFEFVIELPPEVTLSTRCEIHCHGQVVRTENPSRDVFGIAAQVLDYSIKRQTATPSQ